MLRLPLYTEKRAAVEMAEVLDHNPGCTLCPLHEHADTVCIPPEGDTGDNVLLVVGDYPGGTDDTAGIPFVGTTGQWIRGRLDEWWDGPVVYTYALRCRPVGLKKENVKDYMVEACRGYLKGLIDHVKPVRVLALGEKAFQGLTGRAPTSTYVRESYGVMSNGVPLFHLMGERRTGSNNFRAEQFEKDLAFALQAKVELPPWDKTYGLIQTPDDAREAARVLRDHRSLTFDTEYSGGTHTEYFKIDTLAISPTYTDIPFVWDERALADPAIAAPLRELLEDPTIEKVGHNIKVDITAVKVDPVLRATVRGDTFDSLVARRLEDPDIRGDLEYQTELVGMGGHKDEMDAAVHEAEKIVEHTREEYKSEQQSIPGFLPRPLEAAVKYPGLDPAAFAYGMVNTQLRSRYCALDTVATARLARKVRPVIEADEGLDRTWNILLKSSSKTVAQIERWGFRLDKPRVRMVGEYIRHEQSRLEPKLRAHGVDFKLTETAKIGDLLFGKLKIKPLEFTKTGPSVKAKVLEKLAHKHPVIPLIIEYRELDTIAQRYTTGLIDSCRADGRIHCSYNITGTRTGRFSCSGPNMQQIPSRNPILGKMVKNCFIPSPGNVLIQLDYSQLEYREAANLSGDPVMRAIYEAGLDLHRRTAELISKDAWNIDRAVMEQYDAAKIKPYRTASKEVNFGALYGRGANALAMQLGIPVERARMLVQLIMGQFEVLSEWTQRQISLCKRQGYVNTYIDGLVARRRPLVGIGERGNDELQSTSRNASINTPVQGSAADRMLRSLNAAVEWIVSDGMPCMIVGTVHDSIILEAPLEWAEEVAATVVDIMESWHSTVPILADVEVGPRWGEIVAVPKNKTTNDLIWPGNLIAA